MYDLKQFKEILDPILKDFVDHKIENFQKNTQDLLIKDIIVYSKNLITGGGKRIRPYMAYSSYLSFGGRNEKEIMNILLSLELFHNFCLIHDDVIDKGETRHGQKTIQAYVLEKLKSENRFGDIAHIANSYSILIGDVIFEWIIQLFFENKNLKNLELAKEYFYKMADEVLMGQIVDADLAGQHNPNLSLIEEKTRLKTSRYTFVRPMQIGAILADKNYGKEEFLETLGTKLGIAFQMKDDLLDIVGNQKNIQKTPLLDISQHQHTFYTNYIFRNGTDNQKKYFNEVFGKKIKGQEEKIRTMFLDSGAINKGKEVIEENLMQAEKMIEESSLEKIYKQRFIELIKLINERTN